jgi:hypothetical protein
LELTFSDSTAVLRVSVVYVVVVIIIPNVDDGAVI